MKSPAAEFVVRRSLPRYGLAVLSVGVSLGLALLLEHFHFQTPAAILLLFAVAIASWYGGRGPGVLAAILSTVTYYWYFVEPVRTIYIYLSEIPHFVTFVAFAVLLSWFGVVRRRVEAGLRERAALLDLTHDTVFVMDIAGVIKYWNRGAEERYGWTAEQAMGRNVHDLLKTIFPAPLEELKAEVTLTGRWEGELRHTRIDGTQVVVASRWSLQRDDRGAPAAVLETNNDITERKRAEEALRRLNRELRAISNCNQTLLRATDEQSLLDEICRIVCEEAGYRMAWVGYAEHDDAKTVRPVAWAGAESGYLASAAITWADTERGRGQTGTAIRSGKTCCIQEFATDPRLAPWREGLLQRGFRSGIAVPLKDEEGRAFGSLAIHSAQPNAFTPEEVRLLEELAGDMAFGIVALRTQAARKQAEETIRRHEMELRQVLDFMPDLVAEFDADRERLYANRPALDYFGVTLEEWRNNSDPYRFYHPDDRERIARDAYTGDETPHEFEARFRKSDGTYRWFLFRDNPVRDEEGRITRWYVSGTDIEDRKQAEQALRQSETYLAESQRLTQTGSFAWDSAGEKFTHWSEEMFRIYGFDPQKGLPSKEEVFRLILPEDLNRVEASLQEAIRERADNVDEYTLVLPDKTIKQIQVIRHPVLDQAGDVAKLVGTIVDMTERKRAEAALRRSEAYLADALRLTHTGVWASDRTSKPLYWSEEVFRIFGFDPQQGLPTGEQALERIHPEDFDKFQRGTINEKGYLEGEYRILLPDRTLKYVYGAAHPVFDRNGGIVEVVGVIVDITDRKRAEEALRQSEERLRLTLESTQIGIFDWDVPHDVWYASPVYYTALGYEPREGPGDRAEWVERLHPEDYDRVTRLLRDILAGGTDRYEYEARLRHADGSYRWVQIKAFGIEHDSEGKVIRTLGVRIDITELKRAEEALRRAEGYLAEAQRLTHTGAWATDAEPKPLYWSEELFRLYGLDSQKGFPTHEQAVQRVHPEDRDRYVQAFHRVIHQKVDSDVEFRTVLPDGAIRYLYGLGHPILNTNGDVVEVVGTTVDITDRKRAEGERARLRQLEADLAHINRVSIMGELAASISHELNQPIAASIMNASLALQWLDRDPPDLTQARDRTTQIIEAGTLASEIIDRLRSLYKKEQPKRESLTINEVIGEMVGLLRGEATRHAVSVRADFADSLPIVLADRVQIQQVLMNLMLNGIEAMSDTGGVLTVKSQLKEHGQIEISVNDTGPGLPPGKAGQIFDAFFTTKPQGSGMGLAISKSIVESHDGRKWASGNRGRGATFHFTLPAAPSEAILPVEVA